MGLGEWATCEGHKMGPTESKYATKPSCKVIKSIGSIGDLE